MAKSLQQLEKLMNTKNAGSAKYAADMGKGASLGEGDQTGSSLEELEKLMRTPRQQEQSQTKNQRNDELERLEKLMQTKREAVASPSSFHDEPPSFDTERRDSLEQSLRISEEQFRTAETTLQRVQSTLQSSEQKLQSMMASWQTSPTEANRAAYEQAYGQYQNALKDYEQVYDRYSKAHGAYEMDYYSYAYFMNQNQAKYDSWRSGIRDAATLQGQIDALDSQLEALENAHKQAKIKANQSSIFDAKKNWDAYQQAYSAYTSQLPQIQEQKALLQQELDWSQYLQYADLMGKDDFAEKSSYVSTANGKKPHSMVLTLDDGTPYATTYTETGFNDLTYDYINRNKDALNIGWSEDTGSHKTLLGLDRSFLQSMTDEEISIYNYLYATQSPEAADAYIKYLSEDLNARARSAEQAKWAQYAKEHPVKSSIFSALMAPEKGVSYIGQAFDYLSDGKIDQNAGYNRFSYIPAAIREEVSSKWGPVGSFAYNTGMSMADFLSTTAAGMGNPTLVTMLMGSGAAADTVIEAKDRGLSDNQAFALGTVAGLAEAVTEKYSIEALLDADVLKDSLWKYVGKNALTEATEEGSSNIINFMADVMISQDKSQWQQSINAYKDQGCSDSRAFALAMRDQALSLGLDALGGAISGGILGGGGAVIQVASATSQGRNASDLSREDIRAMINSGLAADSKSAEYAVAQRMQKKLDSGKQLSSYEKGLLLQVNGDALNLKGNSQAPANLEEEQTAEVEMQAEEVAEPEKAGSEESAKKGFWENVRDQIAGRFHKAEPEAETAQDGPDGSARQALKEAAGMLERGEITEEQFNAVADAIGERLMDEEEAVRGTAFRESSELLNERKAEADALARSGGDARQWDPDPAVWRETEARPMTAQESFQQEVNEQVARNMGMENPAHAKAAASVDGDAEYDGGMRYGEGNNVSDGDQVRNAGAGAGEQAGGVSGRTGGQGQRAVSHAAARVQRQNAARDLRQQGLIREQSSKELGIASGTDSRKTLVLPEEYYDDALEDLARRIEEETGCRAVFTIGGIEIRGADGKPVTVRGVFSDKQIVLQADHKIDPERLADHEIFHYNESELPGLTEHIRQQLSEEEFDRVFDRYLQELWPVYGCEETAYDEYEEAYARIRQEVMADAYAGINAFGAGATRFTEDVRRITGEMGMGTGRQENGVRQTNGPPGERYSNEGDRYNYQGRSMTEDREIYNYDFLAAQPDMQAVVLPDVNTVRNSDGRIDTAKVVSQGINNARSVGTEQAGKVYVTNRYTGNEMLVTVNSIRHGLNGRENRLLTNARLGSVAGELVRNAIPINALRNTADGVSGTYAMAAYAIDGKGREFVAVITVEQRDASVSGIEAYDVTHAISGRQKRSNRSDTKSAGNYPTSAASVISIADLLKIVKETYQSILSDDVLETFGEVKNVDGYYYGRAMYSVDDSAQVGEGAPKAGEGFLRTDEIEDEARLRGYPVLNNRQVVPFKTWVRAADRGNYGLVVGMGADQKLIVAFHNKAEDSRGTAAIPYDMLTTVDGQYQIQGDELAALLQSEPVNPNNIALSEQELKEINELFVRAGGFQKSESGGQTEELTVYSRKQVEGIRKAFRAVRAIEGKILRDIKGVLGAHRLSDRAYLKDSAQELTDEYLRTGTVSQETMDRLFKDSYERGIVIDRELHDQYQDLKKHLNTQAVTISEQDKADIADFSDFRRRTMGNLRIVNEGGLPVDTFYGELQSMAPGLFPEDITHPADQLVKMYEVAKSLQISERNLSEYYGSDADMYRRYARHNFETAVWDSIGGLAEVRRYLDDRQAQKEDFEKPPATKEEAAEIWKKLKEARKTYEKAMAKNLLTTADEIQVGRLLRGELQPEHLDPDAKGTKGILAVYEGKKEYCRLMDLIGEYRRSVKGKLRKDADSYLETAAEWKDKAAGVAYSRETMERNIEDIVKDPKLAKKINAHFFEPIRDAEAAATRMKDSFRKRVRELGLSRKIDKKKGNIVSEAHAVQLYGEAIDNIRMLEATRGRVKNRDGKTLEEWRAVVDDLWHNNPGLDKAKIENAVQEFRKLYDELFQEMNKVRVRWGYEPVNYRNGYFPHFQPGDGDGILQRFGKALGIDTQVVALPTTINGLTHTFKPGIQWFGNAQERLGFNTAYDAVEGFDKYIEGIASVIHQTENIQKLRALASQVRYRTTAEGIQNQVDEIYADDRLTEDEKQAKITQLYEKGKFSMANFVVELDEYTNLLANKKSKLDRTVEALIGRRFYTAMKWLEARVGANMIAGNLTSAFTNFIPLTQASAQIGYGHLLKGMWQTLAAYRSGDGVVGMSSFLTNRQGSDPLVQTWTQKASDVLGKPMELIDGFVSGSIVRAAYEQNLKRGMPESEAIHQADVFAARVMAERSKGGMPTLFSSSNPLFKLFTQFQLEVNNQFSEIFKDLPRAYRDKAVGALVLAFLRYFLGAWLFNELYEKLIGRRPALDPIDILVDLGGDLFGENSVGIGEAGANFATAILEELPFSSGLSLFGVELDGGRIPVSSAIPDVSALWDAATNTEWASEKRWKEAKDELSKLVYVVPPFGGNQMQKIWKGVKAYIEGGSYSVDSAGNDILQYPVHNDENGDFWNLVRAMLMGKSSLEEAQDWVEDGFDSLTAKQTAVYQDMLDAGVSSRDAYGLIDNLRRTEDKLGALQDADVPSEAKAVAFYGLLASDKERELMDALTDIGADSGEVVNTLIDLQESDDLKGVEKYGVQADVLNKSALTEEEKHLVIGSWLGTEEVSEAGNLTQYGKFLAAMKAGITTDEYLQHRGQGGSVDDLLEFTERGMDPRDASELSLALDALEPEAGKKQVADVQKWRVCVDFPGDEENHLTSLSAVMTDSQFEKAERAWKFGVKPELYVYYHELRRDYDANGNGSYTQAEITATIDAMGDELSKEQQAALWQIVTGSTKAANNPYSAEVGQQVLDAKNE